MTEVKKTAHTPGEWVSRQDTSRGYVVIALDMVSTYDSRQKIICVIPEGDESNAHLIAAAPDLLEALETLIETLNPPSGFNYLSDSSLEPAKAAIKRARGL